MLNGSRIRICLHVTCLTVNEQPGKSADCKRGRSKYIFALKFLQNNVDVLNGQFNDCRVHGSEVLCHWQHSSVAWPADPSSNPLVEKQQFLLLEYLLLFVSKHLQFDNRKY